MINELVIHLGDTKTGSTSIQRALVSRIFSTSGKSVVYPGKSNHIRLARTLSQKRRFGEREERFNKILAVFQKSDADYGIISAEHFQFVDPRVLQDAIETYWPDLKDRVRVVAYVRPHVSKFLSAYSERVKLGSMAQSLEGFFDALSATKGLDYKDRFDNWRDTFGDRFELRAFVPDRLYQGDVVHDFLKYVLGSEDFELTSAVLVNSSLTLSQLSLLREIHRKIGERTRSLKGPRIREAVGAAGRLVMGNMGLDGLGNDGDKLRMPKTLIDRFTDRYEADAEALDVAFFDGFPISGALEQAHSKTIDKPQSLDAATYFSPETISSVHILAGVLADLLVQAPLQFQQTVAIIRADSGLAA